MIINMAHSEEEAREKGRFLNKVDCNGDGSHFVWTYATHEGLCIKEREENGYHDSDFYMTVYDPEKDTFHEILFATTRGWSYPCLGSHVDAPPELMEKYQEHLKYMRRRSQVLLKRYDRKAMFQLAKKAGRKFTDIKKIYELYRRDTAERVVKLLTTNLRSKFRISLRTQLLDWLDGKSQHNTPFSNRQIEYV